MVLQDQLDYLTIKVLKEIVRLLKKNQKGKSFYLQPLTTKRKKNILTQKELKLFNKKI